LIHLSVNLFGAAAVALAFACSGEGLATEPLVPTARGIRGEVVFKNFSHFEETPADHRKVRNEGILQVEWTRDFTPSTSIKLVGDARVDDDDLAKGVRFQIPDTARRRSSLNLVEAVIRLRHDAMELTLGKQIYAWGTGDAYNPTDNINPYDSLDPIDHEKLGVYSAALHATRGPTSFTLVVIPAFTPSRVPLPSSRWAPAPPTGVVDDRQLPSTNFENLQFAARVRTTFHGWDIALSYFDGFNDTPAIRQSSVQLDPLVTVPRFTPVFTRLRAPGVAFSTTYRNFEFHGEFAAKFVESNGAEDRLEGIVGLNYTWDQPGLAWLEQIHGVLEYARAETLATVDPTILRGRDATPTALPSDAFRNALVGRLQFKLNGNTEIKLSGTADFTGTPNHYFQVKLNHKFTDSVQLETGLDFFGGRSDTFWGRWADNDRFFAFLKYLF
jgi:hypothetical protein